MSRSHTVAWYWALAAVVVGFVAWVAIGGAGFLLLRTTWPSYALAEPAKSYTLPMLFSRLAVGVVCTIAAGAVAAIVAKGSRAASWWLGGLLLLLSAPVHFGRVWAEYPVWYHFAYLLPLVPWTILGGVLATSSVAGAAPDQQNSAASSC
jgi:hypothetical protein